MGIRRRRTQLLPSPVAVAGTARREFARRWQKARLPPPLPDLLPSAAKVARPRTRRQVAVGNNERRMTSVVREVVHGSTGDAPVVFGDSPNTAPCPPLMKMDAAVKAKVEQLFGGKNR